MRMEEMIKIAGEKKIKDWKELEKKLKPNYNKHWEEAFTFFEIRICTRYLKPIDAILNMKSYNGEGFAIVNLQCSMIETIESFISGIIHIHPHFLIKNKKTFKDNSKIYIFFFNRFSDKFNKLNGKNFYSNVRNSLLHETQTKKNWFILAKSNLPYNNENKKHIIYRNNFQDEILNILKEYKKSIINGDKFYGINSCELRENFILKFNHICNES